MFWISIKGLKVVLCKFFLLFNVMRFSYGSWFLLFHYSVTLWDNDTFIWIYSSYTVKEKLQRKRNAFPLKQWQCVISLASIYTTRFLSEQLLVIEPIHIWHMQIILHSPDFAGDKSIAFDSSVFWESCSSSRKVCSYWWRVYFVNQKLSDKEKIWMC